YEATGDPAHVVYPVVEGIELGDECKVQLFIQLLPGICRLGLPDSHTDQLVLGQWPFRDKEQLIAIDLNASRDGGHSELSSDSGKVSRQRHCGWKGGTAS